MRPLKCRRTKRAGASRRDWPPFCRTWKDRSRSLSAAAWTALRWRPSSIAPGALAPKCFTPSRPRCRKRRPSASNGSPRLKVGACESWTRENSPTRTIWPIRSIAASSARPISMAASRATATRRFFPAPISMISGNIGPDSRPPNVIPSVTLISRPKSTKGPCARSLANWAWALYPSCRRRPAFRVGSRPALRSAPRSCRRSMRWSAASQRIFQPESSVAASERRES